MTESESGSLLALVLDVNPAQPSFYGQDPAKLTKWLDSAISFVNSHLLLSQTNEAAVIAAASSSCHFLYPVQEEEADPLPEATDGQFEGFRRLELTVRAKLSNIMMGELNGSIVKESLVAGGLCLAMTFVNRYLSEREGRKARILVLTASGSAASDYMNYMNSFFTAQKLGVPIDALVLQTSSGLLQQGADITGKYLNNGEMKYLIFLVCFQEATSFGWTSLTQCCKC